MSKKNGKVASCEADHDEEVVGDTEEGQQVPDGVEAESVHQLQVEDSCLPGDEMQSCVIPRKRTRHQANVEVSFSLDLGILVISISSDFFCQF